MNLVVTLLVGMLFITPTDSLSLQGCGEGATSIRGRIVGGKLSRQGMWPWQVGIHKQSIIDSSRYNIHCGGALIAPQWVLTAAHCFYTRRTSSSKIWHEKDITSLKRYKIIAGDIDTQIREMSEQERFPIEVYIHPGYRHAPYYENDIALVKLNQKVALSPLVRTVCLPISDVDFAKPGTVGTVAGWGRTRKSRISTVLKHTTIGIKDNAICKNATTYFFNKTVTFCAGDGNGRNDACQGDSGGSLVRSVSVNGKRIWVTVGLVSWGEGCGLPGKYGYYTRVHSFVDWINSSMLSCGNPGNIPFGRLIKAHRMKRFPIDFRVKYKCIHGYVLKGKSGRKCKGEGRWTRRPVCVREITCPDPGHPHNGVRGPSRGSYRYKTKIQFHCNRNHVMIGQSSLTCQIDGTWNDYPPLCLAPCQDPGVPLNGIRWGINFKHGQMVRFACKKNSSMIGSTLITCFNGTWNRDTPKCFKVPTCMKPQLPVNAYSTSKLKERYRFNEIIMYACDYGYFTAGSRTQRCGARGKWSELRLKCIPKSCEDPGTPKNGKRRGYVFTFKKKVYFECDAGYKLIGPEFRQCQAVDCGRLATPKYGQKIEETKTTFLGRVTFQCNKKGYELKGSKQRVCRSNGRWDGTLTKCDLSTCTKPPLPVNANSRSRLKAKYQFNEIIVYACDHGYFTAGSRAQRCQVGGKWSALRLRCIPKSCGDPGTPKNGKRRGYVFTFKKRVYYECDFGYEIIGPYFRQCLSYQKWSDYTPTCEQCGSPLGMENRKIPEKNIRASTRWSRQYDAKYGRLNGGSAWCSSLTDARPYLEIDLGKPYNITYLATQGSHRSRYWVSKYVVNHSLTRSNFIEYRESSKEKLFTGNNDSNSIVKHKLKNPFIARKIKFHPVAKVGVFNSACMRVEVYGCDLPNDCVMVGSRVLGRWEDRYDGGDIYYKAIVRTIDSSNVQLEIEDEEHHDDHFKSMPKTSIVLDVPNKQWNLPSGTRVLMPRNNKYFTGAIGSRRHQKYYLVDPDSSGIGKTWIKKDEIRVLKAEQFCE